MNQILDGDYVIHVQYGVGLYQGIETLDERDYLKIKYADEDILYIPVEKLDRLEKYVSYGEEPKLYKLGTRGFKRRKQKLEEEIIKFAGELVEIQAKEKVRTDLSMERILSGRKSLRLNFPLKRLKIR